MKIIITLIILYFVTITYCFSQSGKIQFDVKENNKKAEDFLTGSIAMPKGYSLLVFESKVKLQIFVADDKAALIKKIDSLGTYLVYTKKLANSIVVSNEKSGNIKELVFGKEKTLQTSLPELKVSDVKYYEVVPQFVYELQKRTSAGTESGKKSESDVLLEIYPLPSDLKFEVECKNKEAITAKMKTSDDLGTKVFLKENGKYELTFTSQGMEPLKLNFDITEGLSKTNFFNLSLNASHFVSTKMKSKFDSADENLKNLYIQFPCLLDDFFVEEVKKDKYSVKNSENGPPDFYIDANGFVFEGTNMNKKRKSCTDDSDEKFSCPSF
jgi:hypothetical protein